MHRSLDLAKMARAVATVAILFALGAGLTFALYKAPTYPELKEGELMLSSRHWDEAESWFYKFIKKNPEHAEALRKLGLIELRRPGGDVVRAQKYLERAVKIEADNPIGLFLLAKADEVGSRREDAKRIYDQLVEMGPGKDNPPQAAAVHLARFNRGLFAVLDGENALARDLFGQVLQREPQQAYATWEMCLLALDEKKYEEAIEWGEKAVRNVSLWAPSEAWPYPQGRYGYIRENSRLALAKAYLAAGKAEKVKELLGPIVERVKRRTKVRRGLAKPQPKSPLEGKPDLRFENAPFYYAEALAALGEKKEAKKAFKAFSRQVVGDHDLQSKARSRAKEL